MNPYKNTFNINQYIDPETGEMMLPDLELDDSFVLPKTGFNKQLDNNRFSFGDITTPSEEDSQTLKQVQDSFFNNQELDKAKQRKELFEKYNAIYGDKPKVPYASNAQFSSLEQQAPAFTRLQNAFKDVPPEMVAQQLRNLTKYGQTTDYGKDAEIGKSDLATGGMYGNQVRSSMDALRENLKKGRELVEAKSDPLAFDIEQQVKSKQEKEDKIQRLKQRFLETSPFKNVDENLANLHAEKQALEFFNKQDTDLIEKRKEKDQLLRDKQLSEQKKSKIREINALRQESGLPLLDEETGQKVETSTDKEKKQDYNYSTGMSAEPIQPVKSYIEDRKRSVSTPYAPVPQSQGLKEGEFFISPQDYYQNQYKGLSPKDIISDDTVGAVREPAAKKPSVVVNPEEKKQILGEIESVVGKDKLQNHVAFINKENAPFDKFAKNPETSAEGLYQLTDDAYSDVQRKNNKFKNVSKSEMLKDAKLQAEAYETYMGDIENWIRKNLKTEPTEELKAKVYYQGRRSNKEYNEAADKGVNIFGKVISDDPPRKNPKTGEMIPGKTKEQKIQEQRKMGYDGPYAQGYWNDIQKNKTVALSEGVSRQPSYVQEALTNVPDPVKKAIFAKSDEEFASAMNEVVKYPQLAIDPEKRDEVKRTTEELSTLNRWFRNKSQEEQETILASQQTPTELPKEGASGISKEIGDYVQAYKSQNTIDALTQVQDKANRLRMMNLFIQGASQTGRGIAGAMSGYTVKPDEPFKALDAMADTIEAQYKERAAKEGDDPNSEFSKLITNFGNKMLQKIGVEDNPLTGLSANAATKLMPIIKDWYEADTKANYVRDQKQRDREYKEELIADKEVQKISDNLAKIDRSTKSNIAKPRSIVYQIDRMLALTGRNGENIPNLTGAEVLELIGGLDNIMNNQSTVAGRQKLAEEFNTLSGDIRDIIRYVSNNPVPRGADEFVKRLYKTILREREISNSQLRHYYGTVMAGISDKTLQMRKDKIDQIFDSYLKPFEYEQTSDAIEKNFGLNPGEFEQVKEKTYKYQAGSSEDEKAIRWAKEHKDDPIHGNTAKEILKANNVQLEKTPEQLKSEDNQALNWSKENINNPKYASMAFNILKHHGIV